MTKTDIAGENSIVSLIRSEKKTAEQITDSEVRQMVREAVKLAGGLDGIVKDGQSVVIKPNLVATRQVSGSVKPLMMMFTDPFKQSEQVPELVNGITADRRVTRAMLELVRELNPSGKVYIMECGGDGKTSENFRRMGYTHENIPGVDEFVALGENGKFRDVDDEDIVAVEVENPQYRNFQKYMKNRFYFDKTYFSADVIISLCCLKNHMNAAVTGGIKNVGIGAKPANIYSSRDKSISVFAIGHGWEPLNNFIHDYYSAKPVDFVLTDGLQGLSYGPAAQAAPSYEDAKMNMRLILASKDAVACDTVHACIVGVDPEKINYLKDLSRDGFGQIDTSAITVLGNARVDEVKKQFPFAKGVLGAIFKDTRKTQYDDYEAPELVVEDVSVKDSSLTAAIKTSPKTSKVELYIDGVFAETFTNEFHQLVYAIDDTVSKGIHEAAFHAFDRLLNCSCRVVSFEKQ